MPEPIENQDTLVPSNNFRSNEADGMGDFYEAYYRQVRRGRRTEVAVVVGGLLLALVLAFAVIFFWYTERDRRNTPIGQENVALNN